MDKENELCLQNGFLLNHKDEINYVSSLGMIDGN
jgi:hypothetical protein